MKILQIGLGGFGKKHLATWHAIGKGDSLYVAELSPETLSANTKVHSIPKERMSTNYKDFFDKVDIIDIVTPATTHAKLIAEALKAGKDVFVEKPMTMNATEADEIAALAKKTGHIVQVGFHYRHHPFTTHAKKLINEDVLGDIRYVSGNFKGFKRPRTDVGATHSDAIHFFDLINYLLESFPNEVHSTMRSYMPRGSGATHMDDLSITTLHYPDTLAKVEAGYVQIAEGTDPAVPGALAEQSIEISGSKAMLRIDYLGRKMSIVRAHHRHEDGAWKGINEGTEQIDIEFRDPVECEFEAFLNAVKNREKPLANAVDSGVKLGRIIEAVYISAKAGEKVIISYD